MSAGAGLTFLAWVRGGAVQALRTPQSLDAGLPARASLPVSLAFGGAGSAGIDAQLVGPGDVAGLDARQVIRSDPPPGATQVPPNFFACVEFDRPDLPWMLTPAAPAEADPTDPDPRRGLRPWLCLVVLADRPLDPPTASRPLPRVVARDDELPDLETAWLWAHAQVVTEAGDDVRAVIAAHPERTLSRLVAPHRLEPSTNYLACVVPAFEAGRRAGLGLAVPDGPLALAWRRGAAPTEVMLPVYHAWRFATARVRGDFESLARRVRAWRAGAAGVVPLDVGRGGAGLPGPAAGQTAWRMPLEGVIVGPAIQPGAWPADWPVDRRPALQAALALRLAASAGELAPPTYGALHAAHAGPLDAPAAPRWLRELNLDPRYRVMASLGTRLVQRHQEALVAAAWEQSAALREANRVLRQGQLARAVGEVLEARVNAMAGAAPGRLMQLTRPLHARVQAGAATVEQALAGNEPLHAALSLPFRRVARPGGPLARRLAPGLLAEPVQRLALPADLPAALRPTPRLAKRAGTFDVALASAAADAPESVATLTRKRVETPIFSWESVAQSVPANVPFAYQADLLLSTQSVPGRHAPDGPRSNWIGRGLDFEAVAQLGWQPLAADAVAYSRQGRGSPGGYVERGAQQGLLLASSRTVSTGSQPVMAFQPGGMLEPAGALVLGSDIESIPVAMAFADLAGSGAIDVVCVHHRVTKGPGNASPGSVSFTDVYETRVRVGLDFDPVSGAVRGGWTDWLDLGIGSVVDPPPVPKITAAGARLFLLQLQDGRFKLRALDLRAERYGVYQPRLTESRLDIDFPLGDEFLGGDIAAADFGGLTGIDLLVAQVEGRDGQLRLSYRVAYDIDAQGRVGRLGPALLPPIPVTGAHVDVSLGIADAAGAGRRAAAAAAFRAAAGRTQARQELIAAVSAPPPPALAVDTAPLAAQLLQAIAPAHAVTAAVHGRLVLPAPLDLARLSDPLQPLALTPRFPFPTFELLREAFQERLFPGAGGLPDDTATVLAIDRAALEAFLVGLNHEMSRELLWRQFPLRHGTYFARFWTAQRDEIAPIEAWQAGSALGAHAAPGGEAPTLLLAVRAELLRRIPNAIVYAVPARAGSNGGRTPDLVQPLQPLFGGRLDPDIRFFAFGGGLTPAGVRGSGAADGWYFVFQEHPSAQRFGIDEADDGYGSLPQTWADLCWPQLAPSADALQALTHVDAGALSPLAGLTLPDRTGSALAPHRWGFSAAHMAHILLQRSALVAIHGSDLVPPTA